MIARARALMLLADTPSSYEAAGRIRIQQSSKRLIGGSHPRFRLAMSNSSWVQLTAAISADESAHYAVSKNERRYRVELAMIPMENRRQRK